MTLFNNGSLRLVNSKYDRVCTLREVYSHVGTPASFVRETTYSYTTE